LTSILQQPQVSKHLKVLSEADIVEVQPQANRRIYQLRREPFQELEAWLQSFRRLWEERFDRLDDYLLELQATEQHKSPRMVKPEGLAPVLEEFFAGEKILSSL
jgi:hypothetical protein